MGDKSKKLTVWSIIKGFLIGWAAVCVLLMTVSLVKYDDYIATVIADNMKLWIYVTLPAAIAMLVACWVVRKIIFKK